MAHEREKILHPLSDKHIIVSGGGIAGLAFARGLARHWPVGIQPPRITIYERGPRDLPPERGNYSLSLRSDKQSGGLQAIRQLGLLDEIIKASVPNSSSGGSVRDRNWEPLLHVRHPRTPPDGLPVAGMRITRNSTRETFIQALPEDVVTHYGAQCISAMKSTQGGMIVTFNDHTQVDCDLLVVADGASSKLRTALLPEDSLQYAGVVCIGGNAYFPPGQVPPQVEDAFGPVIGGEGTGLVVFPIDDRSAVWFISHRTPERRTPVQGAKAVEMKDRILAEAARRGAVFGPKFKELLDATEPSTLKIFNAMDKRPITHTQAKELPVVFIGDANHAVSPFAGKCSQGKSSHLNNADISLGNGANMALMDSVSLSKALSEEGSIAEAIAAFDKESIVRCEKAWKTSHIVIRMIHATGIWLWLAVAALKILFWFVNK